MVQNVATLPENAVRPLVTIDLIGDLDATLASGFTETLARVAARGNDVVVNFKYVAIVHADGFSELARSIAAARLGGTDISIATRSRRIRSMFVSARIPCTEPPTGRSLGRHVMIARHATA